MTHHPKIKGVAAFWWEFHCYRVSFFAWNQNRNGFISLMVPSTDHWTKLLSVQNDDKPLYIVLLICNLLALYMWQSAGEVMKSTHKYYALAPLWDAVTDRNHNAKERVVEPVWCTDMMENKENSNTRGTWIVPYRVTMSVWYEKCIKIKNQMLKKYTEDGTKQLFVYWTVLTTVPHRNQF